MHLNPVDELGAAVPRRPRNDISPGRPARSRGRWEKRGPGPSYPFSSVAVGGRPMAAGLDVFVQRPALTGSLLGRAPPKPGLCRAAPGPNRDFAGLRPARTTMKPAIWGARYNNTPWARSPCRGTPPVTRGCRMSAFSDGCRLQHSPSPRVSKRVVRPAPLPEWSAPEPPIRPPLFAGLKDSPGVQCCGVGQAQGHPAPSIFGGEWHLWGYHCTQV
mmetsp:Transcript_91986/g.154317  ORF Transcript_91986/g.154317 Transcript_91986/m.154317 type:complete len:216 (+) Transcript_91986:228-875(+)